MAEAKAFRYKDGTRVAANTTAAQLKADGKDKELDKHMKALDQTWRDDEGRKPVAELTEREKMLEGRIPWNPELLKQSTLPS
ncbi:hypothetical protein [Pseudomonas phage D6]|nr:hypothetical protein [Pseudomonas phage D6]